MSSSDPAEIISDAQDQINSADSFADFVRNAGIGGIFMAIILEVIGIIDASGTLIAAPIEALGIGSGDVVGAIFASFVEVQDSSVGPAIRSFENGVAALAGPFAPVVGIVVIGVGTFIAIWIWARIPISPLTFVRNLR